MSASIKIGCVELIHGNFVEVAQQWEPESFSVVYTDPPYGKEHLHLYRDLLETSGYLLEPGGDLVSIYPQYCAPDVEAWTEGSGLDYRWTITMTQFEGPHPRMVNRYHNIEVCGKIIGWWVKKAKGIEPDYRNVRDAFVNEPKGKIEHEWEQSATWGIYGAETFAVNRTKPALDPMVGTGTFLCECLRRGIPAVGIDIDIAQIERACARLEKIADAAVDEQKKAAAQIQLPFVGVADL